jgi:predicted flap endonuclease-1-like 5' DNA nuclease
VLALKCVIGLCLLAALLAGSIVALMLRKRTTREVKREASRWAQQVQTSNYHIATLQASVEDHIFKARTKEAEAAAEMSARQALEHELEHTRKRLTVAESSLAEAIQEGGRITSVFTAMKDTLDTREQELRAAQEKIAALEMHSLQQTGQDARSGETEATHAGAITELNAEIAALRGALDESETFRHQNAVLHATLRERDTDLMKLRTQMEAMAKQRREDQATFEAHLADLESLGVSLRQAQTKVQALENLMQGTEENEAELERSRARLEELEPLPALLAERTAQLQAAEKQLRESLEEKEKGLEALRQRILFLEGELTRVTQDKGNALEHLRSRLDELEPMALQLAELSAKHQELSDRHQWLVNEKDAELQRLRTRVGELEPLGGTLAERDARMREMEHLVLRMTEEKEAEIRRLRARIGELESVDAALQERDRRLLQLEADHRTVSAEHDAVVGRLQTILQKRRTLRPTSNKPKREREGRVEKDDLKLINGVGPILEKMLNRLGIFTFREIALWTDQDINRVDAKLDRFHGRIRREGWVRSAKREHFKRYGERL